MISMRQSRLGGVVAALLLLGVAGGLVALPSAEAGGVGDPLIAEHVYGGLPGSRHILVRTAYVASYNRDRRVPNWVAYHVTTDYIKTPPRKGIFKSFRKDNDVDNPVVTGDYTGLYDDPQKGYARGHLAPYKISGGDRDGDGKYAIKDVNEDGKFTDADRNDQNKYVYDDDEEVEAVKQVNYMTNIAPQHHDGFNGSPGLWYDLERWV